MLNNIAKTLRASITLLLRFSYDVNVAEVHDKVKRGTLTYDSSIYILAGIIAGDGIVESDGRIRVSVALNTTKGELIYKTISEIGRILGFRITTVKGNNREISIKLLDPSIKKTIGEILHNLTLYKNKVHKLRTPNVNKHFKNYPIVDQ